jgi:hypothetical protein
MGKLRSCAVSYRDHHGIRHSVEVTAESLYEAAVLGLKALDAHRGHTHNMTIDVKVRSPEVTHSVSGAILAAWLAMPGKDEAEQELKNRLKEAMRT